MVDEMEEAKRMSNLGGYQWLTTAAKKVRGPKNLVLMILGAGAVVYKVTFTISGMVALISVLLFVSFAVFTTLVLV